MLCVSNVLLFLQEQNDLVWKIRDGLNRSLKTPELRALLEANGQTAPSGESKVNCVIIILQNIWFTVRVLNFVG